MKSPAGDYPSRLVSEEEERDAQFRPNKFAAPPIITVKSSY